MQYLDLHQGQRWRPPLFCCDKIDAPF